MGLGCLSSALAVAIYLAATQYLNEDSGDRLEEDDYGDFLKAENLCHSGIMPPSNVGGDDPEVEKRKIDGHMGPDFV